MVANFLSAHTHYTFSAQGRNFSVYAFKGREEIHKPFEFEIELVSRSANEDITALLGTPACLAITEMGAGVVSLIDTATGDATRYVHGLICKMEQLHTTNYFTHYRTILVPRLWYLDKINDNRIFQNLSVIEIIQKILQEQGFTEEEFDFNFLFKYEKREYCVQYGETDLHFISRLCEEEGIYFYFKHTKERHCLCFDDWSGGPRISGNPLLRFFPGSGNVADEAVISRLQLNYAVNSNAVAYGDWNFTRPMVDFKLAVLEPRPGFVYVPQGMRLEQYQYPHLYQFLKQGKRYAEVHLQRQLCRNSWLEMQSNVVRFLPGFTFGIYEHPRKNINACWWVISVRQEGKQPGVLEHEAPNERGSEYSATVTALPELTRFVPALEHPKKLIEGLQSAIVTGPQGEEIYTDEYGRVKVQFHWDRFGKHDEYTTCWVRVADSWAGNNFGFIQIPRVEQEVLVEFMEGNPDRPVITGRVYNPVQMPPWELPAQKNLSGIQSREIQAFGRNQIVFDDTQGQIQAQVSSDHDHSQLNLGYITRIDHWYGRNDFRGEGFELRTDGWGVVRAQKGLVLTTEELEKAQKHQKDIHETVTFLEDAAVLHSEGTQQSAAHNAIDDEEHQAIREALENQNKELKGPGEKHGEITSPHILLASSAGFVASARQDAHIQAGGQVAVTSQEHTSLVTGKNFLASAFGAIRLFSQKLGIRLFSAEEKIEIQAQLSDIDIIAQKVLRVISATEKIEIAAAKEITLRADGSYITINGSGIESGTTGRFVAKAASHSFEGPASKPGIMPEVPVAESRICKLAAAKNDLACY